VEDYFNFISLTVFSEEYLKFKHFLEEGQYVFIKARIESRFDNPDQVAIRVNQVLLLSDIMEKFSKVLSLSMTIDELTVDTIYKLHHLAKQQKGRCHLRIRILDPVENVTIDLPSRRYRVNAKEMINALIDFPEIQVRVIGE
jgi:DNA polymerase-3 subunit alpha